MGMSELEPCPGRGMDTGGASVTGSQEQAKDLMG